MLKLRLQAGNGIHIYCLLPDSFPTEIMVIIPTDSGSGSFWGNSTRGAKVLSHYLPHSVLHRSSQTFWTLHVRSWKSERHPFSTNLQNSIRKKYTTYVFPWYEWQNFILFQAKRKLVHLSFMTASPWDPHEINITDHMLLIPYYKWKYKITTKIEILTREEPPGNLLMMKQLWI